MSEVAQVPQLRFPEFSGEWEEKRFDSLYPTVRNGFVGVATPYYVEEGVPYLQGKNIKSGAINRNGLVYINESFHQKSKKSQLRQNDIVMVQSGHVGECAVITEEFEDTNCHALLVSTPTHDIDSKFYINYFYSKFGRKKIYRITTGNTIKHILSSDLKIQTVSNPSYQEQQKIAAFLTAVDTKIEQLSKKQELLGEYKKGLMQQIFSQAIRFKADDGSDFPDWEEKRLGGCILENQKSQIQVNFVSDNTERDDVNIYPFFTSGNKALFTDSPIVEGDNIFLSTGGIATINFYSGKGSYSTDVFCISSVSENTRFIYYYLLSILIKIDRKLFYGSGLKHLDKKAFRKIITTLPALPEQTKIANFLSSVDSKIEQVGKQLDESKQFKKALLQRMFV